MTPSHRTPALHVSDPSPWFPDNPAGATLASSHMPSSLQWLCTFAAFADSGGMVSGDTLAQRLADAASRAGDISQTQTISLVARWIVSRAVVTVMGPQGCMLPMFQFDLTTCTPKSSMAPVLAELNGVFNDVELALWFVSSNNWLDGEQPAMVMHKDLPGVLQAARADRFLARGH